MKKPDIEQLSSGNNNILKPNNLNSYSNFEQVIEEYWKQAVENLHQFIAQTITKNNPAYAKIDLVSSYRWFYFTDYACRALLEANYYNTENNYSVSDLMLFLNDKDIENIIEDTQSQTAQTHFGENSNWKRFEDRERWFQLEPILRLLSKEAII